MKRPFKHTLSNVFRSMGLVCLLVLLIQGTLSADDLKPEKWQELHTKTTIIHFQNPADLEAFNTLIDFGASFELSGSNLVSSGRPKIADKIDALFQRSRDLLGMHGFANKIHVRIFKNRQQLEHVFFDIYRKPCGVRAWYTHERLSIYIQLEDFHEGMLAHEFAHAIMDHYMIIPPPGPAAEILARYVDTHLHETGKVGAPGGHIKAYSAD